MKIGIFGLWIQYSGVLNLSAVVEATIHVEFLQKDLIF